MARREPEIVNGDVRSWRMYVDMNELVEFLPDEEAGKLFKACNTFVKHEIEPQWSGDGGTSPALLMAWKVFREKLINQVAELRGKSAGNSRNRRGTVHDTKTEPEDKEGG